MLLIRQIKVRSQNSAYEEIAQKVIGKLLPVEGQDIIVFPK
jgi:hypothetical protein